MFTLQNISYVHPDKTVLFHNLSFTVNARQKVALTGNNGSGKSTLLKLIAGLLPAEGFIQTSKKPYYIPQIFGQFNELSIAQALHIDEQLKALRAIISGDVSDENFTILNDDWTLEERCNEALGYWQLQELDLQQPMKTLSGGQKTKVFLAGISIHEPEIVLLDEPSNHLDSDARKLLYDFIRSSPATMMIVSHDRQLLNIPDTIFELGKRGITSYGGNYDFYAAQKKIELLALDEDVKDREKALRKAREVERESAERQQKLDARGKRKQEKAGVPTIMMNTMRNNAEKSSSRLKTVHADKTNHILDELTDLRAALPATDKMKFGFDNTALHKGKVLVKATDINYRYNEKWLWKTPLHFELVSGERIVIKGKNGSGKTTLIRLLLGEIKPVTGDILRSENKAVYIDQDYSLIDSGLTVYEQAQLFNYTALQEHEIKIRLSRFLFSPADWQKQNSALSGGERMRLMLCCLTIANKAPDIIILDEPTNNLDIQNIEILTAAIDDYKGTLIVISHDAGFVEAVHVNREIVLA